MSVSPAVDGVLVQWGERLFYPGNRIVKTTPLPRLSGSISRRAEGIRRRIHATVTLRAPQVMVKVTGGGRGMAAIAAHFRYISKNGLRTIEDDRGVEHEGRDASARVKVVVASVMQPEAVSLQRDAQLRSQNRVRG